MNRVHIIGGGFSGLSVGYYLSRLGRQVDVFEKSDRLGGLIGSRREEWGLVETAANGLIHNERVAALFKDLNLQQAPRPAGERRRYIFRGEPKRWPLTTFETVRLAAGLPIALAQDKNGVRAGESLKSWAERNLGEGAFRYLLGPALQGVYGTVDLDAETIVENLSQNLKDSSPFKKFDYQISLKKIKNDLEARGTVAPLGGMQELIDGFEKKIAAAGGEIHLNANGDLRRSHPTVIATSAPAAALTLLPEAPDVARELMRIEYLPLSTVTIALAPEAARWPGFGCLFPANEGFQSLGVLFNNFIFEGRSNLTSETWILPSAHEKEEDLLKRLQTDRKKMTGKDDTILYKRVTSWPHALPHYNSVLAEVKKNLRLPPRIYLIGNYLGPIGLTKILDRAEWLAERIHGEVP